MTEQGGGRDGTLVTLFLTAAHLMVDELVQRVAIAGYPDIRPSDSRVFENLDRDGTRLTELAIRAQMTHQSMGELVAGLESRGYVERVPDPADRRARLITFTPRGRAAMTLALAELAGIERAWAERLGFVNSEVAREALRRAIDQTDELPVPGTQGRRSFPSRR